jgi:thioredoxin
MSTIRTCKSCGQKNRVASNHLADTGRCGACKTELAPLDEPMQVDAASFDEIVQSARVPVLVDFWAEWCGPCRMFGPVYEKVSERHGDAVFGKVDTEAQPEVAATFQIASIPTLMIIRDNIVLFSQAGALPEAALEELVTKAEELDMDEVRASLAASADA